jgi:hypothetical protein
VTAAIDGLQPDIVYHYRLRASNNKGETLGEERSFATGAAGSTTHSAIGDPGGDDDPSTSDTALMTGASKPVLGGSVVVAPLLGTVKIKLPGSAGYATLAAGDAVPVGTVVDTRHGTVKLTSALDSGTQSGEFRGALFAVRQARTGRGMTDLVLQGANFAYCPRPTTRTGPRPTVRAASTATTRKRPLRRLWSRDEGGRFRTHGRNSVATVRGTSWVTTDTCAGTRTTVTQGTMAVRDKHRAKTIIVRAGHSYLARSTR